MGRPRLPRPRRCGGQRELGRWIETRTSKKWLTLFHFEILGSQWMPMAWSMKNTSLVCHELLEVMGRFRATGAGLLAGMSAEIRKVFDSLIVWFYVFWIDQLMQLSRLFLESSICGILWHERFAMWYNYVYFPTFAIKGRANWRPTMAYHGPTQRNPPWGPGGHPSCAQCPVLCLLHGSLTCSWRVEGSGWLIQKDDGHSMS